MSQTRTRVVQTCQSFLDSFAGIFQSFERMAETIFHALLYNNNKKEGGTAALQFLFKETLLIGSATAVWFHLLKGYIANNTQRIDLQVIFLPKSGKGLQCTDWAKPYFTW